ncbi:MAG: YitT family protein [Oscillospiraceae bacterium]|nr:YitT family protein [Oscillospiraceae bacterium]
MVKSLVKNNKITAKEMVTIFFAITLMAMCTYFLNIPNSFCFGGISGLCIAISGAIGFGSPATLSSVINIILLFVGFIFLGKSFGLKTTIATLILSAELAVFEKFIPMAHTLSTEPLMEMVFSVVLHAVSAAILFNVQASSGGSDIIAMIIKKYTSVKDIGKALMICDSVVVVSCYFIFGIEAGMFSTMGMCIKVFMIDSVMETFNLCKYFTIITTKPAEIAEYISTELKRGSTQMEAKGSFTDQGKTVIFTVLGKRQAIKLQTMVKSIDPHAFTMITNTSEVMGKGFRDIL